MTSEQQPVADEHPIEIKPSEDHIGLSIPIPDVTVVDSSSDYSASPQVTTHLRPTPTSSPSIPYDDGSEFSPKLPSYLRAPLYGIPKSPSLNGIIPKSPSLNGIIPKSPSMTGISKSPSMNRMSMGLKKSRSSMSISQLLSCMHPEDECEVRWRSFKASTGRPEPGVNYFPSDGVNYNGSLAVVIPMYNEPYETLKMTLLSLQENFTHLIDKDIRNTILPHIAIILDGWHHKTTHPSTKAYLRAMFDTGDERGWYEELEENSVEPGVYETFVIQKVKHDVQQAVNVAMTFEEDGTSRSFGSATMDSRMLVTLIIKRDNRKKHNSHEWFLGLNGFAWAMQPEYIFATDCGTLFHKDCLRKLLVHMKDNNSVSVCTGRQRVMSRKQQGTDESLFSIETVLRGAQMFDYEASFACYTGTFALTGFLPVIPGPCGLYRTNVLFADGDYDISPMKWYFDVVNTPPEKSGLILGNLRIAEDRVLSYSAVVKAKNPATMSLVPEAVFYFEAELDLSMLALQRRRWINGTWAGYYWLAIQNPGLLFNNKNINKLRALCVWLLLMLQVLVYCVVAIAPAIFLSGLRSFLQLYIDNGTDGGQINFSASFLPLFLWLIMVAFYVVFVYVHARTKATARYVAWMFNLQMLFAAILSALAIVTFVAYFAENFHSVVYIPSGVPDKVQLTVFTILVAFGLPFVLAFIHSPFSALLMLISVIPYYLFLPMITGMFGAYSFARCWDLSWGNRPAGNSVEHDVHEKSKQQLIGQANTLCAIIVFLNLAFLVVQIYAAASADKLFYLVLAIFASSFAQMIIGLPWFLWYDAKKIAHYSATHFFWFWCDHPPPKFFHMKKQNWTEKQRKSMEFTDLSSLQLAIQQQDAEV